MSGGILVTIAALGMIAATCFLWACCIVAADADARSQEHERQADRRAEGPGRGVDVHADFNSTNPERDHG